MLRYHLTMLPIEWWPTPGVVPGFVAKCSKACMLPATCKPALMNSRIVINVLHKLVVWM